MYCNLRQNSEGTDLAFTGGMFTDFTLQLQSGDSVVICSVTWNRLTHTKHTDHIRMRSEWSDLNLSPSVLMIGSVRWMDKSVSLTVNKDGHHESFPKVKPKNLDCSGVVGCSIGHKVELYQNMGRNKNFLQMIPVVLGCFYHAVCSRMNFLLFSLV